MSSKIVLLKIVLIIFLLITAFFTLALAVTDESSSNTEDIVSYNLTFDQIQSGVILQQDNYFWGAFFRIPNTYVLSFTTSSSAHVGLVIIDDVNQPEIDNLSNTTFNYLASLEGSDSIKFSIPAHTTTNQTLDYYNSAYSYYIAIIIFDIQTTINMQFDISVAVHSNLPFPEITYVFITIQVIALAYLLTPSKNTDNKFKKFLHDHSLDAVVGIIVVYSFVSEFLLDSVFLYFSQILLLFFAIYKSKVYEVMLSVKLNKGQRLLASIYLTSLLSYFTTISYHLNVPLDVKAIQFLVYIGTDLLEPLFWLIFGIFIYKRLSQLQLQKGQNPVTIINTVLAISTILVFEYSFTFFSSLIKILQGFVEVYIGNLFLRLIQYGFTLSLVNKGWNKLHRTEKENKSWISIFETPDFQEAIFGLHSEKDLLILLYASLIIFRWFRFITIILELAFLYSNLFYIVSGLFLLVSIYPVWALALRLLQDDDDWRVNNAVLHAFFILSISYSLVLTFQYIVLSTLFGENTFFVDSFLLTLALVVSIYVYKKHLELPRDKEENKDFPKSLFLLWLIITVTDLLTDQNFYTLLSVIGLYFILPGFLIVTIGMVLRNLETNGSVQNLYSSERKVIVLVISIIGFIGYIYSDPLGLSIALQFYGLFVLMFFVSERIVDTNAIFQQQAEDEPSLDLSAISIPIIEIVGLTAIFLLYYFFYLQQGANEGLDLGYDYVYLLFGTYLWLTELMLFYRITHPVNKIESNTSELNRPITSPVQHQQIRQPTRIAAQSQKTQIESQRKQFCTKCGNKLLVDQKFCNKCGTPK